MEIYVNPPEDCDICTGFIEEIFIDGPTCTGPWAHMCPDCWGWYGSSDKAGATAWIHEGDRKYVKHNEYQL